MSPQRWSRALLALGISFVLACGSKGSSTGVTLTISILTRDFVVDELRVRAEVPGMDPTEVRRKLAAPAGDSETVNLLFDSAAAGRDVTLIVEAFSNGTSVLTGRTTRTLEQDKYVTAEVRLAECAAPDGPFCDADTLVACDAGNLHTNRTVCQYGCNEAARRCNTCLPATASCQGNSFVSCGDQGLPLFTDDCASSGGPCKTGTCTPNGCDTSPARQGQTFCTSAQIATTCDNAGNALSTICEFGCSAVRDVCNECDPTPSKLITCRADIESLCNAQVICDPQGLILAKTCCSSNQCTCDGTQCLEDTCTTAPEVGGGGIFNGDLCTGADNVPGDCFPGGVACKSIAAGGQPEKFYRLTLDDQDSRSTFYNVTLDTSGSAAATDLRVSTVCGNESLQVPNAETCALPVGSSAGRACSQDPGPDVMLLCGLPEGEYFGAVDVQSGSCSSCPCSYGLDVTITPVTLDTPAQAGNISRGGVFRGNTCALGDQFSFPTTSAVTGCPATGNNCAAGVCPACTAGAATDCRVGATDSLCSYSGVGGADAVFYLALPVDSGVDISTAGSLFDTVLYILESGPSGASPPGSVRVCNDDCFTADGPSHIQTALAAGLYYVVLDGAGTDCGDFVLTVTVSPSAVCPNLRCEGPFENCQSCPGDCRCQRCGDGVLQVADGEACDDGNTTSNDGCSSVCVIEQGYKCAGTPNTCVLACGDGTIDFTRGEECDDYNRLSADGCSSACKVEAGSICTGTPSICSPGTRVSSCPGLAVPSNSVAVNANISVATAFTIADATVDVDIAHTYIGDLLVTLKSPNATTVTLHNHTGGSSDDIIGNYDATLTPDGPGTMNSFNSGPSNGTWTLSLTDTVPSDDGTLRCWAMNLRPAAACGNATCEAGSETCVSCPGDCPCTGCGNGILQLAKGEMCDDGNTATTDGCSDKCQVESGYKCSGSPSKCTLKCGDGIIDAGETCDDANAATPGCSPTCQTEAGYICEGAPSVCVPGARLASTCPQAVAIPDNSPPGISQTLTGAPACLLGNITVDLSITHTYIGDLIVDLTAPDNTTLHLHNLTGSSTQNIIGNYDLNLTPDGGSMNTFNGKAANGNWKLSVSDRAAGDTGTLNCWAVNLYCQ